MSDPVRRSQEAISRLERMLFDEPAWCCCDIPCRDYREHREKAEAFEAKICNEAWEAEKEQRHGIQ